MTSLYNRARMTTTSTGTTTLTLGSAVTNYQTFANAGVSDGDRVNYVIENGANWETGEGVYTTSGTTLTRSLLESSTGSLLILSTDSEVFIDVLASDVRGRVAANVLVFG